MPDVSALRTFVEGGFSLAILYGFYLMLSHILTGNKKHETVVDGLQQRYIEDLKKMQARHDAQFLAEREIHRQEMRDISSSFTCSLQALGENMARLTGELQRLSLRVETIGQARENRVPLPERSEDSS